MSASRPSRRVGFTLIEIILAISLSAVLFVLVGAGLHAYTRIVAGRRADVANSQLARSLLHYMADDLRATYYSEDAVQDTSSEEEDSGATGASGGGVAATTDLTQAAAQPTPGLYGNMYELQMDVFGQFAKPLKYDMLTAAGIEPYSANLLSEPKIVTYYVRTSDPSELVGTTLESLDTESTGQQRVLVRRVQSRAQAIFSAVGGGATATTEGEQLLSDQVVTVTFQYFDGLAWSDEWDSGLLGGLPVAVKITLTVVDDVASADVDANALTLDNVYELVVALPTAESPAADTSSTGL